MYRTIKCVVKKMLHGEGFPGCLASTDVVVLYELFIKASDIFHIGLSVDSRYAHIHTDFDFSLPLYFSLYRALFHYNTLTTHFFDSASFFFFLTSLHSISSLSNTDIPKAFYSRSLHQLEPLFHYA